MWAFLGSLQSGRKGPVERCTSKNVNELKWCLLHRIAPKIARNSLIIWIIYFGVCLSSAQINSRNLLGMNYVNHLLNFLSWSIYLHLLLTINLFDHDPSHSPAGVFFVWTPSCRSERNGASWWCLWSGWGQTFLTCFDSLDHLCITNIWLLPNFRGEWHLRIPIVTVIYVTTTWLQRQSRW